LRFQPEHRSEIIAAMIILLGGMLALSLSLTVGAASLAQVRPHADRDSAALPQAAPTSPRSADAPDRLTGKERLGRKWMDEQRLDNCNVPLDKRGTKPRPDACPSPATD
jgi:hypothetical protein